MWPFNLFSSRKEQDLDTFQQNLAVQLAAHQFQLRTQNEAAELERKIKYARTFEVRPNILLPMKEFMADLQKCIDQKKTLSPMIAQQTHRRPSRGVRPPAC